MFLELFKWKKFQVYNEIITLTLGRGKCCQYSMCALEK
jgi:hypothetical protein